MYQRVKSLERALKIMELLREKGMRSEFVSPREAAEAAGISSVSAYNILNTLMACGYARRCGRGKYEEGGRDMLPTVASGAMAKLKAETEPRLRELASSGRESFLLVTLNNGKRLELLRIGRIKNSGGAAMEANAEPYAMRTVRVILAWYTPAQLDFFVNRNGLPRERDWKETRGTRTGLLRELRKIREFGGCCDINFHRSMTATAVPVFSADGSVIASLGCYSPLVNTDHIRQRGIFQLLQELSALVGKS